MPFANLLRLWRTPLVRGILHLYAAQVATYLFPLITLPYLARVLGPHAFGSLAVAQALGMYLQLLLEFGYSLTGTREVARNLGKAQALAKVLWGVLGARLLLALPAAGLAFLAQQLLPPLREDASLVWGAYLYALASALNPGWFYRGLERMKEAAVLEVVARGIALLGVVFLVRSPGDAHLVLFVNGLASAFVAFWGLSSLAKEFGFSFPQLGLAWSFLKLGARLFPFHAVNALNLVINPLILSFFAPSAAVGVFAAAERLARSFWALLDPLNKAFLPYLAQEAVRDPRWAGTLALRVLLLQGALGGAGAAFLALTSPWLVHLVFGGGYEGAIPLLRVMAFLLLGGALANALGVQWALAIKQDGLVNRVMVLAALVQVALALALAPRYGPLGVAWGVALTSFVEAGGFALALYKKGLFPGGGLYLPRELRFSKPAGEAPMDEGKG